jgi:hypothetical protein
MEVLRTPLNQSLADNVDRMKKMRELDAEAGPLLTTMQEEKFGADYPGEGVNNRHARRKAAALKRQIEGLKKQLV